MHCLIVFVTYLANDGTSLILDKNGNPFTRPYYTSNDIPGFALGNGLITDWSDWNPNSPNVPFDSNIVDITSFNLSSYYKTASFNEFNLTGEVVSIRTNSLTTTYSDLVMLGQQKYLDENPNNFDKMDNRNCDPTWSTDDSNTPRDGLFDYIAIISKQKFAY